MPCRPGRPEREAREAPSLATSWASLPGYLLAGQAGNPHGWEGTSLDARLADREMLPPLDTIRTFSVRSET